MKPFTQNREKGFFDGTLFWTAWYVVSLAVIVLAPTVLGLRQNLWHLPAEHTAQIFALAAGYMTFVLLVRLVATRPQPIGFVVLAAGFALCFVAPLILLPYWNIPIARRLFTIVAFLGLVFSVLPLVLGRFRWLALLGMTVSAAGLTVVELPKPTDASKNEPDPIYSAYYAVNLTPQPGLVPPPRRSVRAGGGIARYGDGFILVNGSGEFYRLAWQPKGDALKAFRLPLDATPYNVQEFIKDQQNPETAAIFRITDIAVDDRGSILQIYVAHHRWDHEKRCISMRVSATSLTHSSSEELESPTEWRSIFESQPCLELTTSLPPIGTLEGGGGLALYRDGLLLSLGDNTVAGLNGEEPFSQRKDVSYGKLWFLDLAGHSRMFSMGNRNPQGVMVDRDGRVWETEHGPQGGDELNEIVDGGNYGWPFATYGTQYGTFSWPLAPDTLNHADFKEPAHAFVPSVGISQLIQVGSKQFPKWDGDLLVGSLRRQTLYRVRKRDNRVVYVEPIAASVRIRDLAEGSDGRVLIWTDTGQVVVLSRAEGGVDGQYLFAANCEGCHAPPPGAMSAGAPDLRALAGRAVASQNGYPYSEALRQLGGTWTEERLDKFLQDPTAYAPGTNMVMGEVPEANYRRAIIRFLIDEYKGGNLATDFRN